MMIKRHALSMGVMIATAMGITFASCNNDNNDVPPPQQLRSKSYDLKGSGADKDKKVGEITVSENKDSSVNVVLTLNNGTRDITHLAYLISGSVTTPKTDTIARATFKSVGSQQKVTLLEKVTKIKVGTTEKPFRFNEAVAYEAFAKVRYSAAKDSTIAIGNFGKSVPVQ